MNKIQQPKKFNPDFSKIAWIIRIITLSTALLSVLYYLHKHNQGKNLFFKSPQSAEETPKAEIQHDGPVIKMNIPVRRVEDKDAHQ